MNCPSSFPGNFYVKLRAQLIEAAYLIDTASRMHVSLVMCHAVVGHAIPIKWCLGPTTIVKVSSEATTSLSIHVTLQGSSDLKLLNQHCCLISSSCAVGLLWLPKTRVSGDDWCVHLLASINHTLVALFLLHSIVFDSASECSLWISPACLNRCWTLCKQTGVSGDRSTHNCGVLRQ